MKQEILEAIENLQQIVDKFEFSTDASEAQKEYGKSLIRVDWRYVETALNLHNLVKVCVWSNGDCGFVLKVK